VVVVAVLAALKVEAGAIQSALFVFNA